MTRGELSALLRAVMRAEVAGRRKDAARRADAKRPTGPEERRA